LHRGAQAAKAMLNIYGLVQKKFKISAWFNQTLPVHEYSIAWFLEDLNPAEIDDPAIGHRLTDLLAWSTSA